MKTTLKLILDKAGYSIRNKGYNIPKDLRGRVDNPLLAKYFARRHNFLINADFKNCVTIGQFSCEKKGNNPFVNTTTDYIKNGSITYSGSKLQRYFDTCVPKNVAEMFNLKGKLHEDLVQFPANYFVFPWDNDDMESKRKFRERYFKRENKQRGKALSSEHGRGGLGPVSKELGKLEIKTLVELTKSISDKGYLRDNGHGKDIKATILVNGRDYKYLIDDGNHRIAVLSALDYEVAPVRVSPKTIPAFIYRNEVDFWPNIKSGLYTRDQALKIFDSIFQGNGDYYKKHEQ